MSQTFSPARTRVAPSPTGDPHVGTAYMALFDKAWAEKTGGSFVLRIEDTDQARLVAGSEQQIYDSLAWLGLAPDEGPHVGGDFGPYRQSERLETYQPYIEQLIADGYAYYCWCSSQHLAELRQQQSQAKSSVTGYDRRCHGLTREQRAQLPGFSEQPVVRMLIPDDAPLEFDDLVRGRLKAPRPDDQVILKADGFPTYHLAVVVDDHLMGINTVVRGEEWISSTPKHLLLYRWLGFEVPAFAHMPLLRNPNKSKISKRKNPAARLLWFKEQGYLPEAVRNFLQLLGYPPVGTGTEAGEEEVASFADFVAHFSWEQVNTTGPIFDLQKLDWLNGHYLRLLSAAEFQDRVLEHALEFGQLSQAPAGRQLELIAGGLPLVQERATTLADALPRLDFLFLPDDAVPVAEAARNSLREGTSEILAAAIETLRPLAPFDTSTIEAALRERLLEGMGLKPRLAFAPLRVALTGQKVSPPLFESMALLGKKAVLVRLSSFSFD